MPLQCLQQVTMETVISNKMLSFKIPFQNFTPRLTLQRKTGYAGRQFIFQGIQICLTPIQQKWRQQKMVSACKIATKSHQPIETERKLKLKGVFFAISERFCRYTGIKLNKPDMTRTQGEDEERKIGGKRRALSVPVRPHLRYAEFESKRTIRICEKTYTLQSLCDDEFLRNIANFFAETNRILLQ